jgi:hypothetical protein
MERIITQLCQYAYLDVLMIRDLEPMTLTSPRRVGPYHCASRRLEYDLSLGWVPSPIVVGFGSSFQLLGALTFRSAKNWR